MKIYIFFFHKNATNCFEKFLLNLYKILYTTYRFQRANSYANSMCILDKTDTVVGLNLTLKLEANLGLFHQNESFQRFNSKSHHILVQVNKSTTSRSKITEIRAQFKPANNIFELFEPEK